MRSRPLAPRVFLGPSRLQSHTLRYRALIGPLGAMRAPVLTRRWGRSDFGVNAYGDLHESVNIRCIPLTVRWARWNVDPCS